MAESDDDRPPASDAIAEANHRERVRRLPRFSLRTALIVAVVCCLLFGWIGRNAVRMRREEAAFEALQQAGGRFYVHGGDESYSHWASDFVGYPDAAGRLLGWKRAPRVRRVYLNSGRPRDDRVLARALDALPTFPEIEHVDLLGPNITDGSVAALTRLPRLETVFLGNTSVTDAGVERLRPPLRIRELSIWRIESEERVALSTLRPLKELRSVSVDGGSVSREDVAALASLPELEELRLCLVRSEAEDLYGPLTSAKKLRLLQLIEVGCDDADMATIATLPALEELIVNGITDAGLAPLDSADRLRLVALRWPVTHAAAVEHSAKHPDRLVCFFDERPQDWTVFRGGKPITASDLPDEMRKKLGFR